MRSTKHCICVDGTHIPVAKKKIFIESLLALRSNSGVPQFSSFSRMQTVRSHLTKSISVIILPVVPHKAVAEVSK